MKYTTLGKSGLIVSNICLGTMAFGRWIDEQASLRIVDEALDCGINFIDTADLYGKGQDMAYIHGTGDSERILGKALKGRRDKVVLATKVGATMGDYPNLRGYSRMHIMDEIDQQLLRLQTDHIDLYQLHSYHDTVPLEETLRTLDDLVRAGKVRYIGCSNYMAWQIAKANGVADKMGLEQFVSVQPQYNLLSRDIEKELLPFCVHEGVGAVAYSPLARGMLSGKYTSPDDLPEGSRGAQGEELLFGYFSDHNFELVAQYRILAQECGVTLSQFATAFVLNQPGITSAIVGASKPYHVTEAAQISEWTWDDELMEKVRSIR